MKELVKTIAYILLIITLVRTCDPHISSRNEDVYIACAASCIVVLAIVYWLEPKPSK